MSVTIKLVSGRTTLWEMNKGGGIKDEEFFDGLLYGGLFLLKDLPSHYFVQETKFPHSEDIYSSVGELEGMRNFLGHTYVPLAEAEVQTEDDTVPNMYTVWLRDPTEEGEANSVTFEFPAFLQGLFTALDLAKIPYNRVVLHKPIKDDIFYNIQGLNLPDLKDIAK